jgi:hypothetical protein
MSVAELMLQDSDTNVYEERNVELPQSQAFNIYGKQKIVLNNKEKQV